MESEKTKLTEQLSKFDDWYKAVIFDTNGTYKTIGNSSPV